MGYYSFNRPRRDGRLSWPCWLTDSGRFTHKVVTRPAISLAQDRESSPARTGGLTTMLRHQLGHIAAHNFFLFFSSSNVLWSNIIDFCMLLQVKTISYCDITLIDWCWNNREEETMEQNQRCWRLLANDICTSWWTALNARLSLLWICDYYYYFYTLVNIIPRELKNWVQIRKWVRSSIRAVGAWQTVVQ